MLAYLKQARKFLNTLDKVCIVIGNESCDLDSAVCALSLAYFHQNAEKTANTCDTKSTQYIPVLNTNRCDYPVKTEVKFWLEKNNITDDLLIFKNELEERFINSNNFILVDHHISPYITRCIEIIDHRPVDETMIFPEQCKKNIELVGSCATLIGELLLKNKSKNFDISTISYLLYGTILLDTVNLSENAGRATNKDREVCDAFNELFNSQHLDINRSELYSSLRAARADISELTTYQILKKDMKILQNQSGDCKIALCGFPLFVQNFIKKPDSLDAVHEFAVTMNCSVIILMGMVIDEATNRLNRDIGVINFDAESLSNEIIKSIENTSELNLELETIECSFLNGKFYKQNNVRATRKHIVPIIQNIIDNIK